MGKVVLILGGGTGGVAAANVLSDVLPKEHSIAIVDRNPDHLFLASLPLLIAGRRRPEQISRELIKLQDSNIQFIQAEILDFYPEEKAIITERGKLPYDSLIISLGAEKKAHPLAFNPYNLADALQLQEELSHFSQGHIVIFVSSLPFTGAIAPYEIALLLDAYFRKRGLRPRVKITLVTPEPRLFSFASPEVSIQAATLLGKRGINLMTANSVHTLSKGGRLILASAEIKGDLFIGIPHHSGPALFKNTPLAGPEGWLMADPHSLETCYPDVYAIGDAVGIKMSTGDWIPKVGFFAHYQGEVVAQNIALKYAGKKPRFNFVGGASGASMFTDFKRGVFVSLDTYANPPRLGLSRPTRLAFFAKTIFEKYWLNAWF